MINMENILVRTDKNGTQYWESNKCPKCGGLGYIYCYGHVQGGICFKCEGTGVHHHKWTVRTPEYQAKLDAKRIAKLVAKAEDKNKAFLEKQGFNEDGFTYVVLGNTFEIKDELKEKGAKWSNLIGWHFANKTEDYPVFEIHVDEVYFKDYTQSYNWRNWRSFDESVTYIEKIKKANDDLVMNDKSGSQFQGNIGDKVELELKKFDSKYFKTNYSYYGESNFIHMFKDSNGNIFIWKTGNDLENGDYKVKATIKEHSIYNNTKQTVLTRCKCS